MPLVMRERFRQFAAIFLLILASVCLGPGPRAAAQSQEREDEIVANLAGGRVIVHVTKDDVIVFAAINQPVETGSIPPRVMDIDHTHVGVLLGASEWRLPADPKPVRLDRDFQRIGPRDPRNRTDPTEAEPDLETIGVAFLERLRPLVGQLHHKIEVAADEPLFEIVVIGYAPNHYGPEAWTIEYRVQQEVVGTRGDYWQTRILRPRFTQLYPPEKHAPRTIVEARYPANIKGPTVMELIQRNDPRIALYYRWSPASRPLFLPRWTRSMESTGLFSRKSLWTKLRRRRKTKIDHPTRLRSASDRSHSFWRRAEDRFVL